MKYDVVIVGGGPGGLHCGRILSENGVKTLILERKKQIGKKVCAGGITWRGLIKTIPETLIERTFKRQIITTRYQKMVIEESMPMIATINRIALGTYMADLAENAGTDIISGAYAETFDKRQLCYRKNGSNHTVQYDFLIGADGSNSRVRKFLKLPGDKTDRGIGIQYTVNDSAGSDMIWNFDAGLFASGYSWIFPHRDGASVGAYSGTPACTAQQLKNGLDRWLGKLHIDVSGCRLDAEQINWNYRDWRFGHVFLVGDAAGLASPLTGEGINPAFVSGETAARTIIDTNYKPDQLERIVKLHRSHKKMLNTASKSRILSTILSEISTVLLRYRIINFKRFEMA